MSTPEPTPSRPSEWSSGPPTGRPEPDTALPVPGGRTDVSPDAYAGFWIRLLAALIDGVLISIVSSAIDRVLGAATGLGFLLGAAYFTYFHATAAGQTVGNRICNIRIVDDGTLGSITYIRAFIRWLISLLSGVALAIGYLWMLWDPKKQTWHDKVANSLVVKTSHYPTQAGLGQPA